MHHFQLRLLIVSNRSWSSDFELRLLLWWVFNTGNVYLVCVKTPQIMSLWNQKSGLSIQTIDTEMPRHYQLGLVAIQSWDLSYECIDSSILWLRALVTTTQFFTWWSDPTNIHFQGFMNGSFYYAEVPFQRSLKCLSKSSGWLYKVLLNRSTINPLCNIVSPKLR